MPGHIASNIAAPLSESVDSKNKFEDLSGIDATAYENPYDALIEASQGDPVRHLSLLVFYIVVLICGGNFYI